MSAHVVIDLEEARTRMQRSCGHSILARDGDGHLKCSWCGLVLDDSGELGEPA